MDLILSDVSPRILSRVREAVWGHRIGAYELESTVSGTIVQELRDLVKDVIATEHSACDRLTVLLILIMDLFTAASGEFTPSGDRTLRWFDGFCGHLTSSHSVSPVFQVLLLT